MRLPMATVLTATAAVAVLMSPAVASATHGRIAPAPMKTLTVSELTGFTSPSGNIGCYIDADAARCDIDERDWAPPPKPADCPEFIGFGQGLTVTSGGDARFVCAGDTALGGGQPLAYGDSITAGSLRCASTEAGIECRDSSDGSGFSLSRQGYDLY